MKHLADTVTQISKRHYICTIKKSIITKCMNKLIHMERQRNIDTNHVDEMIKYQNNYYKKHKEYFFPNPIIIGLLKDKYYILDGQHRLNTNKRLTNECNITCSLIETDSKRELDEYLKLINSNKPYVQVRNDQVKIIENYLLTKYTKYSKNTKEPRIPHFKPNNIVDLLNSEYKDVNIDSSLFIQKLEELNTYITLNYKEMGILERHYRLCVDKDTNNPYYVGCISHNRWVYAVISSMSGKLFENIDFTSYPYTTNRKSIPKRLKESLWEKYNKDSLKGKCYVCENDIKNTDFDCGHVIAVHRGGTNDIDNIRCVCRVCNNDMGSKNLYTYKQEYNNSL